MRIKKKNITEKINPELLAKQTRDAVDAVKGELKSDDKTAIDFIKGMSGSDSVTESIDAPNVVQFKKEKPGEEKFVINGITWQYVWAVYPDGKSDIGVYRYGQDIVYAYDWFMKEIIGSLKPISELSEDEHDVASRGIEYGIREPELGPDKHVPKSKTINYGEKQSGEPDLPFEGVKNKNVVEGRSVVKTIKLKDFKK